MSCRQEVVLRIWKVRGENWTRKELSTHDIQCDLECRSVPSNVVYGVELRGDDWNRRCDEIEILAVSQQTNW